MLDGWLGGLAGWLGPAILTLFLIASPYLLYFHFKFYQNWMKIIDFMAVRLVAVIGFSQKSVETLKPCKIQLRLVFSKNPLKLGRKRY